MASKFVYVIMLRKVNIQTTFLSGLVAAILFVFFVFLYIRDNSFRQTWLLYMGSFLFMIVMWIHTIRENRKRRENESTVALVFISHVATIAGVIFSVILCFIMLSVFVPGYLESGNADQRMVAEPANIVTDKTDGLSFQVFFAATVINFSVGSFVGIILPFY